MIHIAALLGLAASFPGMTSPPNAGNFAPPQESFVVPLPGGTGTFTTSITGDFDGNGRLDVAVLRDGTIDLIVRPGGVSWCLQSAGTFNHIAARPAQEEFVAVDASGAHLCSLAVDTFVMVPIETSAWADATLVDSAMTDVGGSVIEERIVGVMSDALSLKSLRHSSGWISESVSIDPQTLPGPIVALELVDIDGDQAVEIVLGCESASACALLFYELDGQPVSTLTPQGFNYRSVTSLTSGHQANGNAFVAWSTLDGSGVEMVYVHDANGLAATVPIGSSGVVGATTAAWTDDDHDDLALALANGTLQVLTNLGSTSPSFGLSNFTTIDPGTQSGLAEPAAGDVDGDGDEDLVLALQTAGELAVHRSGRDDHWLAAPIFTSLLDNGIESAAMTPSPGCSSGIHNSGHIHTIAVTKPQAPHVGSTATHIAYTIWRQEVWGGTTSTSTTSGEVVYPSTAMGVDLQLPLSNPLSTGCTSVDTNVLFYFELELLERDSSGNLVQRFPATIHGVETQSSGDNAEELEELRTSPALTIDVFFADAPPITYYDPEAIGTLDRIRRVPGLPGGYTGQ